MLCRAILAFQENKKLVRIFNSTNYLGSMRCEFRHNGVSTNIVHWTFSLFTLQDRKPTLSCVTPVFTVCNQFTCFPQRELSQ